MNSEEKNKYRKHLGVNNCPKILIEKFKKNIPEGNGLTMRLAIMASMEMFCSISNTNKIKRMWDAWEKYDGNIIGYDNKTGPDNSTAILG